AIVSMAGPSSDALLATAAAGAISALCGGGSDAACRAELATAGAVPVLLLRLCGPDPEESREPAEPSGDGSAPATSTAPLTADEEDGSAPAAAAAPLDADEEEEREGPECDPAKAPSAM
ncbi:unnamed protein product, partial [Polarella glacialis]